MLVAIVVVGVPELLDAKVTLPLKAHKVALGLMLFYFGSRSSEVRHDFWQFLAVPGVESPTRGNSHTS